ncbi:hypothetical protein K2173_016260 [Erythroxylum novogranatense]|uniref:RING-type E3 ubiquitin transferase n=1 Tax=Erythroxylum novogranatense TaxID=1862640 RepID=A0AAV8SGD0_9ROSI|nr:hypothetical protein K2173_016260 [Erythroxylum novogranatense]
MADYDNSTMVDINSRIMGLAMIILFLVVISILFHLFPEWFKCVIITEEEPFRPRQRLVFSSTRHEPVKKGLDPSILRCIPLVVFQSNDCKDRLDCAVCLSEVLPGEEARFLPKCNHGFHIDCIDMWLQFHSTCPLCRNSLAPSTTQLASHNNSNHLGDESQISEEIFSSVCPPDQSSNDTNVFSVDHSQVIVSDNGCACLNEHISTVSPLLPPPLSSPSSPCFCCSSSSTTTITASVGTRHLADEKIVIDVPMQTR